MASDNDSDMIPLMDSPCHYIGKIDANLNQMTFLTKTSRNLHNGASPPALVKKLFWPRLLVSLEI
jgi:hypothetical protein